MDGPAGPVNAAVEEMVGEGFGVLALPTFDRLAREAGDAYAVPTGTAIGSKANAAPPTAWCFLTL